MKKTRTITDLNTYRLTRDLTKSEWQDYRNEDFRRVPRKRKRKSQGRLDRAA
jgi:hypothetical protein